MLLVIKVNTAANEDAGIFKAHCGGANTHAQAEQNQHLFV